MSWDYRLTTYFQPFSDQPEVLGLFRDGLPVVELVL
jgi:hypothetical protein